MTVREAAALLRQKDNILILTHRRPDGDTMGCAAGLCAALRQLGKRAWVLENPEATELNGYYAAPYLAPADAASFFLLREQLSDVLSTLTPREKRVLEMRFGLLDGRNRTLEEVGQDFGVTRERIRQIEAKALRKLRHPSRSKKLKDYLD